MPQCIKSLDELVAAAKGGGRPARVAIARCADEFVLEAAQHAYREGLTEPVLIGDMDKTREVAAAIGFDISSFTALDVSDDETAVFEAVRLYREGKAELIMKGLVSTGTLLRAVLNKETGVPPSGILSHTALFEAPEGGRLMLMTDPAVNIRPNLQRKVEIVKNALGVARKLGIIRPRVAMLAASEKVNYPAMPATLDADLITKMATQGELGDAIVAGPLQLDIALSPKAAELKGVDNPVAGRADILVASDIESGNILYKALNTLYGADMAGVVVGSDVPIVVPSRGDSTRTKFYSLALGVYLAAQNGEGAP